jgi:hypothetical protein
MQAGLKLVVESSRTLAESVSAEQKREKLSTVHPVLKHSGESRVTERNGCQSVSNESI